MGTKIAVAFANMFMVNIEKEILRVPINRYCEKDSSMTCFHCALGGGVLPEDLGRGVRRASGNPYPISDLTQNLIPYFRTYPNPISFA